MHDVTTTTESILRMSVPTDSQRLLRRALLTDGVVSGAVGLLMTLAADPLAGLLGLHATLLRWAGISLLPFAAVLVYLAMRSTIPRPAAWAVVGCNLLWVAASFGLLVTGWTDPTAFGYVFVIGQAVAVICLAELQYVGLRRSV